MRSGQVRNYSLDGLRGVAAVYVVFFHILNSSPWLHSYSQVFQSIIVAGASMVQVFFVISGYCIALSLKNLSRSHVTPIRAFVVRRFFRLIPLWLLLLVLMRFVNQIQTDVMFGNLLFYFGEMKFGDRWFPVIPAWSLQVEVIFYLIAAIYFKQIASLRWQTTFGIYLIALFFSSVWGSVAIQIFHLHDNFVQCFFLSHFHYFFAGILLHSLSESGFSFKKYFNLRTVLLIELVVIIFYLLQRMEYFHSIKIVFLSPLLVLIVMQNESWIQRILTSRPLQILGQASFGIYILQDQARMIVQKMDLSVPFFLSAGMQITSCVVFGVLAFYLIERPFIRWSKKF